MLTDQYHVGRVIFCSSVFVEIINLLFLGRKEKCDISIRTQLYISKEHLIIQRKDGDLYVKVLSRNGIMIDERFYSYQNGELKLARS